MNRPEFPYDFVKNACPKVLEARYWREIYRVDRTDDDDMEFAECAFYRAGAGMECESCQLFLTRPYCGHKKDETYLPLIEKYYDDYKKYEEWLEEKEKEDWKRAFIGENI